MNERVSRTDKILDLLDATLQSTTPRHHGADVFSPDTCVGCNIAPAIEGRSWCERCLPENDDKRSGPPGSSPDNPSDQLPGFTFSLPLSDDEIIETSGMFAIFAGDMDEPPLAGLFVDDQNMPVGLGINLDLFMAADENVIEGLQAVLLQLLRGLPIRVLADTLDALSRATGP
jgi:hypothetical protein